MIQLILILAFGPSQKAYSEEAFVTFHRRTSPHAVLYHLKQNDQRILCGTQGIASHAIDPGILPNGIATPHKNTLVMGCAQYVNWKWQVKEGWKTAKFCIGKGGDDSFDFHRFRRWCTEI